MKITRKIDSVEYSFELDSEELKRAFEEFQHLCWLQDAERQLLATFDDIPEWVEDVSEEDRQAFLQAYGFLSKTPLTQSPRTIFSIRWWLGIRVH